MHIVCPTTTLKEQAPTAQIFHSCNTYTPSVRLHPTVYFRITDHYQTLYTHPYLREWCQGAFVGDIDVVY